MDVIVICMDGAVGYVIWTERVLYGWNVINMDGPVVCMDGTAIYTYETGIYIYGMGMHMDGTVIYMDEFFR